MRSFAALSITLAACAAPGDKSQTVDSSVVPVSDATTLDATPLAATPVGTWTFVPLDGMLCGNGTATGIGINRGTDDSKLFVFFEGGGACWDQTSCYGLNAAVNLNVTYGAAQFATDANSLDASGIVDRTSSSVFADATFIFVPYCTGDIHAGDAVQAYDGTNPSKLTYHHGSANTTAVVAALQTQLPTPSTVWVTGSSAGGYGATLNFFRFASAFPDASVNLFQDSSPFVEPVSPRYQQMQTGEHLVFPPNCTGCDTDLSKVIDTIERDQPSSRIALTVSNNDIVMTIFFNFGVGNIAAPIEALVAQKYMSDTAKAVVFNGTQHVFLTGYPNMALPDSGTLGDFVDGWAAGDERFVSHHF